MMENEKNVAFRSALSGYHREDVNRYILQMNHTFEEQREALTKQAEEAEDRLAALEAQIQTLTEANAQAEAVITALREENDARREAEAEYKDRAETAAATIASLRAELDAHAVPGSEADKSQKYDAISAQIGEIVISANQSADQIVTAARTEADRIVGETEKEAAYIRARLSDTADDMLSTISKRLHDSTDHCLSELFTTLTEMRNQTDALLREFSCRSSELGARIEYYHSGLSESVEKDLADMDAKYGIRK